MAVFDKTDNQVRQNTNINNPQESIVNQTIQVPISTSNQPVQNLDFGKRSATGRMIATIFSLLILLGGIAAGVLLVQQQQEIREQAAGLDTCVKSAFCELIDEPNVSGTYEARFDIKYILITTDKPFRFDPGVTDNDCYRVTISKNVLMWSKYGQGSECVLPVNIQVWLSDTN